MRFILLGCVLALTALTACSRPELEDGSVPAPPKIEFAGDVLIFDEKGSTIFEQENGDVRLAITAPSLRNLLGSRPVNPGSKPRLLIVPAADTRVSSIIEFANVASTYYKTGIEAQMADSRLFVHWQDREELRGGSKKPNPLTLVVKVKENGDVSINNEPRGVKLSFLKPVTELLQEIFKERRLNGVFREGTDIVETTVLMQLPGTMAWNQSIPVASAIREAGSDRIGLLTTDFYYGEPSVFVARQLVIDK